MLLLSVKKYKLKVITNIIKTKRLLHYLESDYISINYNMSHIIHAKMEIKFLYYCSTNNGI